MYSICTLSAQPDNYISQNATWLFGLGICMYYVSFA